MKVLVLINNNLKYDTRVKRHVNAIAENVDKVHVLARPIPDEKWGLENDKVEYSYFQYKPTSYPMTTAIKSFAEEWGILEEFDRCFPFFELGYGEEEKAIMYAEIYKYLTQGKRWRDISGRKSEEMSSLDAQSYVLHFMDVIVQYAIEASKIEADVVLCNDIDTLLCGVIHKIKYNSRLIYDVHDIFADIAANSFPQIYSDFLVLFDSIFIKYADTVMSVTESMLKWELNHFDTKAMGVVMLNCSKISEKEKQITAKQYSNNEKIRIYYHGMSGADRPLWELVEAIKEFSELKLVLRCLPSENLEKIKQKIIEYRMEERTEYLDIVESDKIVDATNGAGDIGYDLTYTEKCLNHKLALTNKFIEYSKAGLPIITSKSIVGQNLYNKYKYGYILDKNTTEALKKVFRQIIRERENLSKYSANSLRMAKNELDWEKYKEILIAVITDNRQVLSKKVQIKDSFKDRMLKKIYAKEDLKRYNKAKEKWKF